MFEPTSHSRTITSDEVWIGWMERACAVNEYAAPDKPPVGPKASTSPSGSPSDDAPGTDFNKRGSWNETGLFDAGWDWAKRVDTDRGLLKRPGKESGVSASIGMVTSEKNGWPLFWCWSTSVNEFVSEQPYTRFAVFTLLKHGGDYSEAAKDLRSLGYGRNMPEVVLPTSTKPGEAVDGGPERIFLWMSELQFRAVNDKWLWHGFISRGGVTLLSAFWKSGKSTLLSYLIRSFDGRTHEFLDREVLPSRILYVTEEHEELWAERRDELSIGDHVGMICRPFKGRSSPAEWVAFIGKLAQAVTDYRFDIVIFDTISKLWPVREENDAGQVEDALMPVWALTNQGVGVVLVHHDRKSGGKEFTGMRGSGGLPAFCETLIEFKRTSDDDHDCKRILNSIGRYKETPRKILIELTPSGYISHGHPDESSVVLPPPKERDWRAMLDEVMDEVMPEDNTGATFEVVQSKFAESRGQGIRRKDLLDELNKRVEDGEYQRLGLGTKGSPYRWFKVSMDSFPGVPPPDISGEP